MCTRRALWHLASAPLVLLLIGLLAGGAAAAPAATSTLYLPMLSGPGHLIPPERSVGGHSLEQAARLTAAYNVTLDPARLPQGLPYVILNATPGRVFSAPAGTSFYVPVAYADDSPPIVGAFPASASATAAYFFGRDQLGAHDCYIEVDGLRYGLGPAYLSGPVTTDPLPDGGGTHYLTLAAFLAPLAPGDHSVSIGGTFDGDAVIQVYGAPVTGASTYIVVVE